MRYIYTILISILATSSQIASAQCGPTSVSTNPDIILLCEGSDTTVNFSTTGNCSGVYEYQVSIGATVIQGWSSSSSYTAAPTTETEYTVHARCNGCPTNIVTSNFEIIVSEEPDVTGDLFICSGETTSLVASTDTSSVTWWDSEVGGNQLSTDSTYTTSALTSTTSFWAQVGSNTGTVGITGSVLITECGTDGMAGGTGSEDYIEISNLYTTAVNTTGWVCAISDSYSNINTVNSTYWYLPSTFSPCSVVTKTDVSGSPNYFGTNIFWNPTNNSWAIIIDDVGNVVDFIAWGWTAAEIASFNPTINGFSITLGPEWTGNGCPAGCGVVGGVMNSFSRVGNADNNNAADFVCQPTSTDVVNPTLSCGWTASTTCPYEVEVLVDIPPTATVPNPIKVQCASDIPAPDISVITDEADDYTTSPQVTFVSDVSDGGSCPETISRTYRVTDSCSNYIDVVQLLIINDTINPVFETPPANISVQCVSDYPALDSLAWTDNCSGSGSVVGVDVSNGNSCPEIITRTWSYTDDCGNTSSVSQTITINDTIKPLVSPIPAEQHQILPPVDVSIVTGVSDNCSTPTVAHIQDVSNNGFCPEIVTRSFSVTDDCGNETIVSQELTIGDPIPNAAFTASESQLTNMMTDVDFVNHSTGASSYIWNFGDNSTGSTELNTSHTFPYEEGGGYYVELIAISPFGCTDTAHLVISIKEEVLYFIPNSFTPDGDSYNQTFQPEFYSGFDPYNFEMLIYNRWGELIFETHNASIGWDGTYQGKPVIEGNYIWKVQFKSKENDDKITDTGSVTLFR